MKFKMLIVVLLIAVVVVISSCASKKHRYNQCPTFSNKIENTAKPHGIG
ncbi:MAG TPA: hypothetical protein PKW80_16090 [Bacteroidales bacterium]|nr:hypothetical protein [Bacteroidales bacterium]